MPHLEISAKVYKVQKTDKTPSDWADTVDDNCKKYQLNLTDEQIEATSKYKFERVWMMHVALPFCHKYAAILK